MNKFYGYIAALLICLLLCGCSDKSMGLNEITDKGTRKVSNSLGENYTVEYEVKSGLHHDVLRVSISSDDFIIANYSGRADKLVIPEKIVRLCENCYYFSGDTDEGIIVEGALVSDTEISESLRDKISREEVEKTLGKCGYSSEKVLKCYDNEAA